MEAHERIRNAHTQAADARQAARELHEQLSQPDMELVVFFCSSQYDLDALADEINRLFAGIKVVGCTTAGEIGALDYCDRSLVGMSFPSSCFSAVTGLLDRLQDYELARGQEFSGRLLQALESKAPGYDAKECFAFMMIDGLSIREEPVVRTFQNVLGRIPLVGGSAGDDLAFTRTWVFAEGAFRSDSAVLVLATTTLPFRPFKTQHFCSDNERLVVTEADPAHRIVKEINGLPAAEEYARLVGCSVEELGATRFASSPVVVVIDGTDYVRSIQKANPDGSLTFYCAIDEGLVLRVAHGERLVDNLNGMFESLRSEIGPLQGALACDCILRNLEITHDNLKPAVADVFRRNNTVGFSTYGEQFGGVHVNQTLTGIAFGEG